MFALEESAVHFTGSTSTGHKPSFNFPIAFGRQKHGPVCVCMSVSVCVRARVGLA